MARTNGALFSLEASGQFGQAIVFDRRGYARGYTVPANPRTPAQAVNRKYIIALSHALSLVVGVALQNIQRAAPIGYRWRPWIIGVAIGSGGAHWTAVAASWAALSSGLRAQWDTAFNMVLAAQLPYSGTAPISGGLAAFVLSVTVYEVGAGGNVSDPREGVDPVMWRDYLRGA